MVLLGQIFAGCCLHDPHLASGGGSEQRSVRKIRASGWKPEGLAAQAELLLRGGFQGLWDRVRVLDAKWSEAPREDAFSPLAEIAELLTRAKGITETEIALVTRGATSHRLGERRSLVSAFDVDGYLAAG